MARRGQFGPKWDRQGKLQVVGCEFSQLMGDLPVFVAAPVTKKVTFGGPEGER
jgi:hypothetical protein